MAAARPTPAGLWVARRVNAISPTVFTESLADYGAYFPGVPPVDLAQVARAYVRSIEGAQTGHIYELD
ncbi:hypothetical protein GCM10009799_49370 [Nocardiopsis rhodophaea]|uniref:Short chain dehydrogenase n=1 Tax=Nocardiopsis rhodophaea TaxID=280238 RepID=A0ABN2TPD7_9ACTN